MKQKLIIVLVLTLPTLIYGQLPMSTYTKIDNYLNLLSHFGYTGGFAASDPNIRFLRAYGFDVKNQDINKRDLVIPVASISKTFTAYAIMKLAGEKKLTLTDPLKKWFPNVSPDKSDITIHELLSHSSGLAGDFFTTPGIKYDSLVRGIFEMPLTNKKGKWGYSNAGYSLLALIVEKASGMNYNEYLKTEVFWPLGLRSTGFVAEKFLPSENFSRLYNRDLIFTGAYELPGFAENIGASDIVSNLNDLLKWAELSADSSRNNHAFTIQHTAYTQVTPLTAYGYGWFIEKQKDGSVSYRHGGNMSPYGLTLELRNYPAFKMNYILTCTKMNEESPLVRIPRTEIGKMITDSSYTPNLLTLPLELNRSIDSLTVRKSESLIKLYTINGLNYLEIEGQAGLNAVLSLTEPQTKDAQEHNQLTAGVIEKLVNNLYGNQHKVVQADWNLFERLNGKIGRFEPLGTILTEQDQWVSFYRCYFKNKTQVVRFLWEGTKLRYIAQNENFAPRWNIVKVAGSSSRWMGYDVSIDKSFYLETGNKLKINNTLF